MLGIRQFFFICLLLVGHPPAYSAIPINQHEQNTFRDNDYGLITPISDVDNYDYNLVKLGWLLFKDPNLSSNGLVSCETCHSLQSNGAEQTATSKGVNGQGIRNSITVFNTSLNYRFFWDGRANSLSEQIDGPITNPLEMDSNWQDIEAYVAKSSFYREHFQAIDDSNISESNIKRALIAFMNTLLTPNAKFDQYLKGNKNILSDSAKRGWLQFQKLGCIQCHQGANIGGGMIQKFGYFGTNPNQEDTGRHINMGKRQDKFYFRVASLRNVANTAPYFHDGRTQDLKDAISIMAQRQLGINIEDETLSDIESFLHSLSAPRPKILEVLENE
ncbi:cytochrome B6 [Vibrio sinensis]|uniref:Cytochrome B6 n=1 Tax=Vibrio sinensis TaxID=2302434 RepID=A0A3A6QFQ7_9VIBR|nr:cytochrome c peroxidase [Vibrio sinensis]RJX71017.1 cytochrome B6 [Vibrio sinensis]